MITTILDEQYVDQSQLEKLKITSKRTLRRLQKAPTIRLGKRLLVPIKSLSSTVKNRISKAQPIIQPQDESLENPEIRLLMEHVLKDEKAQERFTSVYDKYLLSDKERAIALRTHALMRHILNLKSEGFTMKLVFCSFKQLAEQHQLSFCCSNYNYFIEKLSKADNHGIDQVVINQSRGEAREAKKFTEQHKMWARYFYSDPRRFKYRLITEKVNHQVQKRGLYKVSISTIKKYLRQKEIQNFLKPFRLGKRWARENIFPFLRRSKPKYCNSQWQIDCTDLPFYVWETEALHPIRWSLCICVDTKSIKVLAWRMLPTENTRLVLTTLFDAIRNSRVVPVEILHDQGPSFTSHRFTAIEGRLFKNGCYSHAIPPGEPQQNGTVEKVHDLLQDGYLCYEEGFLGKNFGTKREENRALHEVIQAHYTGKIKLSLDVVRGYVEKAINLFNNGEIWREKL